MAFNYFEPDGRIKIMKVVETLPDGTRVFEDGSKAAPSRVLADGKEYPLQEAPYGWKDKISENVSRTMSEYVQSMATGAGYY